MEPPLKCEGCDSVLDKMYNVETRSPVFTWKPERRRYILTFEGEAEITCPYCDRDLSRDYTWNTPEEYKPPLLLWRVTFDDLGDDTIVLEAETEDEALDSAKQLYVGESNIKVTQTEQRFPE